MFSVKLKLKVLLLLMLSVATVGAHFGGGTVSAECGTCGQVFDGTKGVGWGCVQSSGSNCVATSTGCTQCASCSCSGGSGGGPRPPVSPPPHPE
jgi:hypothetical protein